MSSIADWGLTISDFVVVFKSTIRNPQFVLKQLKLLFVLGIEELAGFNFGESGKHVGLALLGA